mmetsp:Transcript_22312/g.33860  ORF Transcript_22312/g.33860 Transcript_22312/m.33860 type:complete len:455 (+) Transcript_22312:81-1445(+)
MTAKSNFYWVLLLSLLIAVLAVEQRGQRAAAADDSSVSHQKEGIEKTKQQDQPLIKEGKKKVESISEVKMLVNEIVNTTGSETLKITRKRLINGKIPTFPEEEEPDFLIPSRPLKGGELSPLVWRETGERVDPEAFLIGIPEETTSIINDYLQESGLMKLCEKLMYEDPVEHGETRLYTIDDGLNWGAMGPKAWTTGDLTWVDAGDERAYEKTLDLLRKGNFDVVLDAIGKKFKLDGLMVQGVGVIIVSKWTGNNMHFDIGDTGNKFFNIIFPANIPSSGKGALEVGDRHDHKRHKPVKFRLNTGVLLGGETRHGTGMCDYRDDEEFRIGIAIYLADLTDDNIEWISGDATSLFPNIEDIPWFESQKGRVWSKHGNSLKNDTGRRPYYVKDDPKTNCKKAKTKGKCTSDLNGLRMKCLKTCEVYMEDEKYYQEIFGLQTEVSEPQQNSIQTEEL